MPISIFTESVLQSAVISVSLVLERVLYEAPKPGWTSELELSSSQEEAWAGVELRRNNAIKIKQAKNRLVIVIWFVGLLGILIY